MWELKVHSVIFCVDLLSEHIIFYLAADKFCVSSSIQEIYGRELLHKFQESGGISVKSRHRSLRTDLCAHLFRDHIILDLASDRFVFIFLFKDNIRA